MFKWDKPKATIRKVVLVFSFILSMFSIVGLAIFYSIFAELELINKLDAKLANNYSYTIRHNFDESRRLYQAGDEVGALELLEQSYQDLKPMGKVDKNYELKRNVITLLARRYIQSNNYVKALDIIVPWM